jgi:membrane protein YqaA with SNARE-associated domain
LAGQRQAAELMEPDMDTGNKKYPVNKYLLLAISLILLTGTVSASIFILSHRDNFSLAQSFSYPGLFIIALITGSPLPVPTFCAFLVFSLGSVNNPALVGLIAGAGVAIGQMLVYWSGRGGYRILAVFNMTGSIKRVWLKISGRFPKKPRQTKLSAFLNQHSAVALFLFSVFPNPMQMPALLASGAKKVSFWKVFAACWAARTVYYTVIAYLGYFGLSLWK